MWTGMFWCGPFYRHGHKFTHGSWVQMVSGLEIFSCADDRRCGEPGSVPVASQNSTSWLDLAGTHLQLASSADACHHFCLHSITLYATAADQAAVLRPCNRFYAQQWGTKVSPRLNERPWYVCEWEYELSVWFLKQALIDPGKECKRDSFHKWFVNLDNLLSQLALVCHLTCFLLLISNGGCADGREHAVILSSAFRWSISWLFSIWKAACGWLTALWTYLGGGGLGITYCCYQEPTELLPPRTPVCQGSPLELLEVVIIHSSSHFQLTFPYC